MKWFKLHHDIPGDIKLRRFSAQEKWAWVCLLCLASQSKVRGVISADDEDISDFCEFKTNQDWLYFKDKLIAKGMVDFSEDGLKISHWEDRQYEKPSDKPSAVRERVSRFRAKRKSTSLKEDETPCNALQTPCNADETLQNRSDQIRSDSEEKRSASSSVEESKPAAPAKTDRFFGQPKVVRRIEMVNRKPRWDENAPWVDDAEREQLDTWLRKKYSAKLDPPRYAQKIVRAIAQGEPCVDWEEFKSNSSGDSEAAILADWGKRQDWENFPLLQDWRQKHAEMGVNAFVNLGGRYSPQHRFSDWLIAQEVAC